ncbi:MAG TPA: hypothetical protein VH743_05950 [Beijerinckiaceae bacterium]|jgi:hypothetical protein
MKIVQGDEVAETLGGTHREGVSMRQRLLDGEVGSPDNYSLVIARSPGRYSPRHRHNFEQFRFQLEGVADYGRTGKLKPGMVGYFPESVHYGPQTQPDGEMLSVMVLQFAGASGNGYPGRSVTLAVAEELKQIGHFKEGVFYRNEGLPGKKQMDGFQAIWEHYNKRPLEYSAPRYNAPILMDPENFDWVPVDGSPGAFAKDMGTFTERCCGVGFIKLEAGSTFEADGARDIYVVLSGTGTVEGQGYRLHTTVMLDRGERAQFTAKEPTAMIHMRLPDLRGVGIDRRHDPVVREAAE